MTKYYFKYIYSYQQQSHNYIKNYLQTYRLSLADIEPFFKSLALLHAKTLHASLAKSRSRTSDGETGINANASLSSLIEAHPTFNIMNK